MRQLDIKARETELRNLPASAVQKLARGFGAEPNRKVLQGSVISYSDKLLAHDQRQSNFYEVLQAAVHNSSEYSTVMQIFGLYPLASIPVAAVTNNVLSEIAEWYRLPQDQLQILGALTAYGPAEAAGFSRREVHKLLEQSKQNPLGIPDIGNMRQRGHHAIKFVGRAHFDDPHLFDLNFKFN